MKIMFSCIHFPIWPYLPKIMIFKNFYTSKLYGLTGMIVFSQHTKPDLLQCYLPIV